MAELLAPITAEEVRKALAGLFFDCIVLAAATRWGWFSEMTPRRWVAGAAFAAMLWLPFALAT